MAGFNNDILRAHRARMRKEQEDLFGGPAEADPTKVSYDGAYLVECNARLLSTPVLLSGALKDVHHAREKYHSEVSEMLAEVFSDPSNDVKAMGILNSVRKTFDEAVIHFTSSEENYQSLLQILSKKQTLVVATLEDPCPSSATVTPEDHVPSWEDWIQDDEDPRVAGSRLLESAVGVPDPS